ncbi:MAG: hypothetical protein KKH98_14595 [Spirochaetes bacterium]|nr:hypothetical protein [Spirochaetota bacterium]
MNINDILSGLNAELKKESLEKDQIVSKVNTLVKTYNEVIEKLKKPAKTGSDNIDDLKQEVKQSEKKYKKKVIDLNTIFEIAKELSSSLHIDDLMKTIILTSMGHMLVETGVVFVLDEKLNKYIFRHAKGIKEDLHDIEFKAEDELMKFLSNRSKPLPLQEILSESFGSSHKGQLARINCELLVPIRIKNKFNGILFLGAKAGNVPYSESNLEFLTTLGNFASIAIENARLYEDIDKKVKDLSTLYDISKEINKSVEMDIAVNLMIETITTGFGASKGSIILFDELKDHYRIEKNFNITEPEAGKYLDLMKEGKLNNPLNNPEGDVLYSDSILTNGDIYFSVPLIAGNKKVGLLNIYRFAEGITVDEDIKKIFSIIASQMAPPIVLTQYLSKRNIYRENPFDYIYNILNNIIEKSKETGTGFVVSKIKFHAPDMTFIKMKELINKIKGILQESDILIHSNFDELMIVFPASLKDEVTGILDNFIPSLTNIKIGYMVGSYPEDGDSIEALLNKVYIGAGESSK